VSGAQVIPFPKAPAVARPAAEAAGRPCYAFVDIAALDEPTLFALIDACGAKALFDMRPCPVFERPRFRHKPVVFRLYDLGVRYHEFAMLVYGSTRDRTLSDEETRALRKAIDAALSPGPALFLYDGDARAWGWLEQVRLFLRHAPCGAVELNPRSLAGRDPNRFAS